MNREDIINMAREAGFTNPEKFTTTDANLQGILSDFWENLDRFANLVAAHKAEVALAEAYRCGYKDGMEAAAVICENLPMQQDRDVRDECAAAIRARGTT